MYCVASAGVAGLAEGDKGMCLEHGLGTGSLTVEYIVACLLGHVSFLFSNTSSIVDMIIS